MYTKLADLFTVLQDPTRIEIVSYLYRHGETSCQALRDHFPLSQPTMSHHFSKLIEARILTKAKQGTSNFYSLNQSYVTELNFDLQSVVSLPSLQTKLDVLAQKSKMRQDPQAVMALQQATGQLEEKQILKNVLRTGQKMTDFSLPDAAGRMLFSQELREQGKQLILVFYRGQWCPYCNLQLRELQKYVPEFSKYGAELLAISPQTPDATLSTQEKMELEYHVLSDQHNRVARKFGLVFTVPAELKKTYKKYTIDLEQANGDTSWELPLAATYVVGQDGVIKSEFVSLDYTKRMEPQAILEVLKQ